MYQHKPERSINVSKHGTCRYYVDKIFSTVCLIFQLYLNYINNVYFLRKTVIILQNKTKQLDGRKYA